MTQETLAQTQEPVPPPWWPAVENILNEYGLQAIDFVADFKQALAQTQEPVAHSVIAGALFDFMGWLTSRKERIVSSSANNASPAVEAITEFAKMRNLSLDDAKVLNWNTTPPQRTWVGLTDEQLRTEFGKLYPNDIGILELAENNRDFAVEAIGARHHWVAFQAGARAAEAKLKELNT